MKGKIEIVIAADATRSTIAKNDDPGRRQTSPKMARGSQPAAAGVAMAAAARFLPWGQAVLVAAAQQEIDKARKAARRGYIDE